MQMSLLWGTPETPRTPVFVGPPKRKPNDEEERYPRTLQDMKDQLFNVYKTALTERYSDTPREDINVAENLKNDKNGVIALMKLLYEEDKSFLNFETDKKDDPVGELATEWLKEEGDAVLSPTGVKIIRVVLEKLWTVPSKPNTGKRMKSDRKLSSILTEYMKLHEAEDVKLSIDADGDEFITFPYPARFSAAVREGMIAGIREPKDMKRLQDIDYAIQEEIDENFEKVLKDTKLILQHPNVTLHFPTEFWWQERWVLQEGDPDYNSDIDIFGNGMDGEIVGYKVNVDKDKVLFVVNCKTFYSGWSPVGVSDNSKFFTIDINKKSVDERKESFKKFADNNDRTGIFKPDGDLNWDKESCPMLQVYLEFVTLYVRSPDIVFTSGDQDLRSVSSFTFETLPSGKDADGSGMKNEEDKHLLDDLYKEFDEYGNMVNSDKFKNDYKTHTRNLVEIFKQIIGCEGVKMMLSASLIPQFHPDLLYFVNETAEDDKKDTAVAKVQNRPDVKGLPDVMHALLFTSKKDFEAELDRRQKTYQEPNISKQEHFRESKRHSLVSRSPAFVNDVISKLSELIQAVEKQPTNGQALDTTKNWKVLLGGKWEDVNYRRGYQVLRGLIYKFNDLRFDNLQKPALDLIVEKVTNFPGENYDEVESSADISSGDYEDEVESQRNRRLHHPQPESDESDKPLAQRRRFGIGKESDEDGSEGSSSSDESSAGEEGAELMSTKGNQGKLIKPDSDPESESDHDNDHSIDNHEDFEFPESPEEESPEEDEEEELEDFEMDKYAPLIAGDIAETVRWIKQAYDSWYLDGKYLAHTNTAYVMPLIASCLALAEISDVFEQAILRHADTYCRFADIAQLAHELSSYEWSTTLVEIDGLKKAVPEEQSGAVIGAPESVATHDMYRKYAESWRGMLQATTADTGGPWQGTLREMIDKLRTERLIASIKQRDGPGLAIKIVKDDVVNKRIYVNTNPLLQKPIRRTKFAEEFGNTWQEIAKKPIPMTDVGKERENNGIARRTKHPPGGPGAGPGPKPKTPKPSNPPASPPPPAPPPAREPQPSQDKTGDFPHQMSRYNLYPHQIQNKDRFMIQHELGQGAIVCDEPGLGKTASAIACACSTTRDRPPRVLVVCPVANISDPWYRDITEWTVFKDAQTVIKYEGAREIRERLLRDNKNANFWIMGDSQLKGVKNTANGEEEGAKEDEEDEEDAGKEMKKAKDEFQSIRNLKDSEGNGWDCVIFDEAHKLKDQGRIRAQKAIELVSYVSGVLLLTGTPFVNKVNDLATLCKIAKIDLMDGETGNGPTKPDWWKNKGYEKITGNDVPQGQFIGEKLKFMMRSTIDSIGLVMPPRYIFEEVAFISEPQKQRFTEELKKAYSSLKMAKRKGISNVLACLGPLRMVTNDIDLCEDKDNKEVRIQRTVYRLEDLSADELNRQSPKFAKILKIAEQMKTDTYKNDTDFPVYPPSKDTAPRKVIVFSDSLLVLNSLAPLFRKRFGKTPEILSGESTSKAIEQGGGRLKVIANFEDDADCSFLFVSTKAGSTGLDMRMASGVIFATVTWTDVDQRQAYARAWRLGQKRDVRIAFVLPYGPEVEFTKSSGLSTIQMGDGTQRLTTIENEQYLLTKNKKKQSENLFRALFNKDSTTDFNFTVETSINDIQKMMPKLRRQYLKAEDIDAQLRKDVEGAGGDDEGTNPAGAGPSGGAGAGPSGGRRNRSDEELKQKYLDIDALLGEMAKGNVEHVFSKVDISQELRKTTAWRNCCLDNTTLYAQNDTIDSFITAIKNKKERVFKDYTYLPLVYIPYTTPQTYMSGRSKKFMSKDSAKDIYTNVQRTLKPLKMKSRFHDSGEGSAPPATKTRSDEVVDLT